MRNGWTGGQYSLFRIVFGLYLFVHFVALVPWGAELFSSVGVLPHATASPLVHLFPNVLALFDAAGFVQGLLAVGALLSLVFALGRWDRMAALVLWYCWACLLGRNPLILNPRCPTWAGSCWRMSSCRRRRTARGPPGADLNPADPGGCP